MTQLKNTKGPWSFDFHGINQAGTGLRIAKLSQPSYDHSSGQPKRIESFDADGHLMAASPELFEALEIAKRYFFDAEPKGRIGWVKWSEDRQVIIEATQKAKGEGGTDV